jgi:hypothetical protein|eukprot:COSAG01_NODE_21846_length_882_cov_1.407407_1_plen_46_part_00
MIQKVDRIRFQQYHLLQPAVVLTAVVAVVAAEVEVVETLVCSHWP